MISSSVTSVSESRRLTRLLALITSALEIADGLELDAAGIALDAARHDVEAAVRVRARLDAAERPPAA